MNTICHVGDRLQCHRGTEHYWQSTKRVCHCFPDGFHLNQTLVNHEAGAEANDFEEFLASIVDLFSTEQLGIRKVAVSVARADAEIRKF